MKRILVTGTGGAASSNFVDALRLVHEDELCIVGTDARMFHLPLSRTDRNYLVPRASDAGYLEALNRVIARERIDFVHAQPDAEVEILSDRRGEVAARTFLPLPETIRLCADKLALQERLHRAGVPIPEAYSVRSEADLRDALAALLERHDQAWLRATRGAGSRASLPVRQFEHARAWIDYWRVMHGVGWRDFMVSEFLPGREFAFQSLWHGGRLVVSQARERLEYVFGHLTPSGQTSSPSVARTVRRADVNHAGTQAVLASDPAPSGVFCVDMKEDADGRPRVTEINCGRFFTTSNFFAHAGINMPWLYVRLGMGEAVAPLPPYDPLPEGLYWVRMIDMGYRLVKEGEWGAETA